MRASQLSETESKSGSLSTNRGRLQCSVTATGSWHQMSRTPEERNIRPRTILSELTLRPTGYFVLNVFVGCCLLLQLWRFSFHFLLLRLSKNCTLFYCWTVSSTFVGIFNINEAYFSKKASIGSVLFLNSFWIAYPVEQKYLSQMLAVIFCSQQDKLDSLRLQFWLPSFTCCFLAGCITRNIFQVKAGKLV